MKKDEAGEGGGDPVETDNRFRCRWGAVGRGVGEEDRGRGEDVAVDPYEAEEGVDQGEPGAVEGWGCEGHCLKSEMLVDAVQFI